VCGCPTSSVPADAIEMRALTHDCVASAPSPACESPVARCIVTPATVMSVLARTTVEPADAEVTATWHSPVSPEVVHVLPPGKEPGPETIENVTCVPAGAGANPSPAFAFTCAVNGCGVPARPMSPGEIWMFASTTASGSQGASDWR